MLTIPDDVDFRRVNKYHWQFLNNHNPPVNNPKKKKKFEFTTQKYINFVFTMSSDLKVII